MAEKTLKGKIIAKGTEITVLSMGSPDDYISLTDIARYKNPHEPKDVVVNWMRLRNTIEYLGIYNETVDRRKAHTMARKPGWKAKKKSLP